MLPSEKQVGKEAYEYGYDKGKVVAKYWKQDEPDKKWTEDGLSDAFSEWWESFTQYDEYANTILPDLREIAGYEDEGYGTYRVVPEGVDEDELYWNEQLAGEKYEEGLHQAFCNVLLKRGE